MRRIAAGELTGGRGRVVVMKPSTGVEVVVVVRMVVEAMYAGDES